MYLNGYNHTHPEIQADMQSPTRNEFPNKTAKFFYKLCVIAYYTGTPNFWIKPLPFPRGFAILFRIYSHIITVLVYVFLLLQLASFFTQTNLTAKQQSNQIVFITSFPMLWSYYVSFSRHAGKVKKELVDILKLKEVYNDVEVEKRMMKKSKLYSVAFGGMCSVSMCLYSFDALMQVIKKEGTFTTVITAWPMVDDPSTAADLMRLLCNFVWWCMMFRVFSVYAFVFSLISCMSHQFVDLQSYFQSLGQIFSESSSQRRKELNFEEAYKVGIKLHSDTLKCVEQSKITCGWQFSGQIIFNVTMLVILMVQLLKAERNLMHAGAIGVAAFCILLGTGLFMTNAGDVTVQASELCTAMYSSGWEKCQEASSVRVRKLVITSMVFAQRPVVIKGLGIVDLSYESYVSLVKTTYSVFSLIFPHTQ